VGFLTLSRGETQKFPGGFTSRRTRPEPGVCRKLFGEEAVARGLGEVVAALRAGEVPGAADPERDSRPADAATSSRRRWSEFVAVADILANPIAEVANVVIPATAWPRRTGRS